MLADLQQWLQDAEVTLEREDDVVHISMEADLPPAALRDRLAQFGAVLASFSKDGVASDQPPPADRRLPWLIGVDDPAELDPGQVAALKNAWVDTHPAEYQQLLHAVDQ